MADRKCTVVIKNDDADPNERHKYFAYFVEQDVAGGSLTQTLQPVFFSTEGLESGDQADFKVSSQLYAVIAKRKGFHAGRSIGNKEEISLIKAEKVDIGRRGDDGTALVVKWDNNRARPVFDGSRKEMSATSGRFSILCDASIPHSNAFVVGLARRIGTDMLRPVAIVPCVSSKDYLFSPREKIYIERCKSANEPIENGIIMSASTRDFGMRVCLPLRFDGEDISVSEKLGRFYVDNLPGQATYVAAEESEYDEGPVPARRRTPPAPPPPHPASTSGNPYSTSTPRPSNQDRSRLHSDPPAREPNREEHGSARTCSHPPNAVPSEHPTDHSRPSAPESSSGGGRASDKAHQSSPDPNQQAPSFAHEPPRNSATTGQASCEARPETRNQGGETPELSGPDDKTDDESDDEALLSFDRLRNFHTVFVVDDTGSMLLPACGDYTGKRQVPPGFKGRTRWAMVLDALQYIADIAAKHDESGIDVYFLVQSWLQRQGIRSGSVVRDLLERRGGSLRYGSGPTKFEPALRPILEGHLEDYRESKKPGSETAMPRPLDLIVLTDGVAKDKKQTESLIVKTAQDLTRLRAVPRQIGIQFVQVGEDRNAKEFLKHLDDGIKSQGVRDIVDTKRYDNQEGGLPLKEQLAKILLGAMDDDIDEEE
ncbi:hypothetical protein AYL99_09887 [Fonsecaea erecta]|uniref:VWFA domain-containing protein n=1 Tax=Fonsecaea erecta TaxID=1367422 RepID=A0A178Z9I9_9EURO|nr:hypothetical protein AYL99_09887 [Fonsecaea erecta]OAP55735.1 hypothetical protein AYL99_09887 [Fonsecaea erecta]